MSDDGFVEVLFEFVDDEDCCQGEQLVEVDVAVSFDMMPLIFLLFYKKRASNGTNRKMFERSIR